ncbi:hypothetical protein T492DRAFT_272909 [Pavlovales sp. CCMP2436]|nr:hypothetical protein T492DRAFT_272909 [Pavlovales sp. CCMP2436]
MYIILGVSDEALPVSVEVVLESPASVSVFRIRNYSKTPSRGVSEYELYADDLVVARGVLRPGGGWQAILFADDDETLFKFGGEVCRLESTAEAAVLLVDAGRVLEGETIVKAKREQV